MKTFRKIWKGFWEPVLRLPLIQWLVALLMSVAIWFVYLTSWKQVEGKKVLREHRKKPAVFVFWHGRSMMLSPIVRMYGFKGYAIASRHKDGRMMAKLQRLFGLKAIYGSTSEGGVSVLRQGVRVLKEENAIVCMSPDGPSGPSLRVHDGALYFAKMTGAPIIPICFTSSGACFQNRWDRYLVALPFSKLVCKVGQPIYVDRKSVGEDFEKIRTKVEKVMVKQMRDLDAQFHKFKVEQDLNATEFKKARREEKEQKKKKKKKK